MKQEYSLKSPTILQPREYYERPNKTEGGIKFKIESEFEPAGDQPNAIKSLTEGLNDGLTDQVLLGVTGSGKTYTMAKIIESTQRPALIMAHNKTLAAQLYGEMKSFFPNNSVEYFVSYYDYYQPEAYVPRSDTFIEKDASINESIDRMRHAATRAIFERDDVIIVASVSCIYGMGAAETYLQMAIQFNQGMLYDQRELLRDLVALQYKRNDMAFTRGAFRVRGDVIEIFPSHFEDRAWRLDFFGDELESIRSFDADSQRSTDSHNDIDFKREVFSSFADDVIIVRLTANKPGMINCSLNVINLLLCRSYLLPICRISPIIFAKR